MSSSCAVEINGLLLAIESGQTPYPIFFHNFGCGDAADSNNGDQTHRPVSTAYRWPQAGDFLTVNDFNKPILATTLCDTSQGRPSPLNCPIPTIKSAIIPPNITVIFRAKDPLRPINGDYFIGDPGQVNMTSNSPGVAAGSNVWTLNTTDVPASSLSDIKNAVTDRLLWRSRFRNGTDDDNTNTGQSSDPCQFCGNNFTCGWAKNSIPCNQWISVCRAANPFVMRNFQGTLKPYLSQSMMSCGQPFFPSLMGLANVLTEVDFDLFNVVDRQTPRTQISNGIWQSCTSSTSTNPFGSSQYCFAGTHPNFTFRSLIDYSPITNDLFNQLWAASTSGGQTNSLYDYFQNYTGGRMTVDNVKYGTCDCISIPSSSDGSDGNMCVATQCGGVDIASKNKIQRIEGNLESIEIQSNWNESVIRYCVGADVLNVGGQTIKRYGQGTDACDEIMTNYCLSSISSTQISSNQDSANYCTCIWSKQALDAKFTGLNLPVNCFEASCNTATPFMYRTKQDQQQCTGSLCQQIIKLVGNDLVVSGIQNMLCNGSSVPLGLDSSNNTSNNNNSSSGSGNLLSNSNDNIDNNGFQITSLFYGALAILALGFLMAFIWLWRRHIISQRKKKVETNQKINLIRDYLKI